MTPFDLKLLNDFQRDFPLVPHPYAFIAERLGTTEEEIIETLRRFQAEGVVSRVGAVFATGRLGSGVLAALAVPVERLEAVAAFVSAHPEVNHNYQRSHRYNLWFVVTASSRDGVQEVLARIATDTRCPMIALPLVREYHIDLGFDLAGNACTAREPAPSRGEACALPTIARALACAVQDGIELDPRPFAALGARAGLSDAMALELLQSWCASGLVKRFGVIVRHHELGITANAMCVWDVPDALVDEIGGRLAHEPAVTLCYRRERALPDWPYNLFCMIHGREQPEVERTIADAIKRNGLAAYPHAVLFSTRRFKQRGARYLDEEPAHG